MKTVPIRFVSLLLLVGCPAPGTEVFFAQSIGRERLRLRGCGDHSVRKLQEVQ